VFKAVVFDLDGVLVDSEGLWRSAYAAVLSQHLDEPVSPDELVAYEGGRVPDTITRFLESRGAESPPDHLVQKLGQKVIEQATETFGDPDEDLLMMSSVSVVEKLWADEYPTAVASNSAREFMDVVLAAIAGRLGVAQHGFRAVSSALEVPHAKPEPDVYFEVARLLQLDPGHCVAIEDSLSGVRAATAAGMTCIGLWRKAGDPPPEYEDACKYIDRGQVSYQRLTDLLGLNGRTSPEAVAE
jgi:mannitol-1-/sugar-/sorbitol-6-/2-deoxyglucose-6-phosphatase